MTKMADAINLYNAAAQWTIQGDDYETLNWLSDDIVKPTKKQLEDLIPLVDRAKADQEIERQALKAELLAKIGISEEEFKTLIS